MHSSARSQAPTVHTLNPAGGKAFMICSKRPFRFHEGRDTFRTGRPANHKINGVDRRRAAPTSPVRYRHPSPAGRRVGSPDWRPRRTRTRSRSRSRSRPRGAAAVISPERRRRRSRSRSRSRPRGAKAGVVNGDEKPRSRRGSPVRSKQSPRRSRREASPPRKHRWVTNGGFRDG